MPYKNPIKRKEHARNYARLHKKEMYEWKKNNPEKVKKYLKRYYQKLKIEKPEKLQEKRKKDYLRRKHKWIQYVKAWRMKYPEKRKIQMKRYRQKYRLAERMRKNIWYALRNKKMGRKWEKLVGYTLQDLLNHLEKQFDDKMSWDNYGSYWVIDHIKPRSLFKYETPEDSEFKKCWALENLQPLERITNSKKSNKF